MAGITLRIKPAFHNVKLPARKTRPFKLPDARLHITEHSTLYDKQTGLTPETLADELHAAGDYVPIPDYAFDCHTGKGKKMGRTKADFFKAEQAALEPFQPGLFDHLIDG